MERERQNKLVWLADGMPRESKTVLLAFNLFQACSLRTQQDRNGPEERENVVANSHCRGNRTGTVRSRQLTNPSFAPLPLRNVSKMISLEQAAEGFFCFGIQLHKLSGGGNGFALAVSNRCQDVSSAAGDIGVNALTLPPPLAKAILEGLNNTHASLDVH